MKNSDLLLLIQSLEAEVSVLQRKMLDIEERVAKLHVSNFDIGKLPVHRPATSPPTPGWVCPSTPNGA